MEQEEEDEVAACAALNNSEAALEGAIVALIEMAYRRALRCEGDENYFQELWSSHGDFGRPKTLKERISFVVGTTTGENYRHSNKIIAVIRFAMSEKIPVHDVRRFIASHNGVAACVRAYRWQRTLERTTIRFFVRQKQLLKELKRLQEAASSGTKVRSRIATLNVGGDGQWELTALKRKAKP